LDVRPIVSQIGLRNAGDSRGPRIHDLRHRLAITTLTRWHRCGVDVERHLPELSTYLGHAHITDYAVVFDGDSATAAPGVATGGAIRAQEPLMKAANRFPALLESFFMID